jgi:phage I-like protein
MDVSSHTTLLPPGDVPVWVHLLPGGKFFGSDGRGPYTVRSPDNVIAASMAAGRLPMDENHSTQVASPQGRPAPARGWIVALQARPDGIWGEVEWNEAGHALMTQKAYRSVSPVFAHEKDGTITRLISAALTNAPNLKQLTSLNTTLTAEQRKALKPADFAVPSKQALPIPDAHHVTLAWDMVDDTEGLSAAEKAEARQRIRAKAKELGVDTSGWAAHTHTQPGADMEISKIRAVLGLPDTADEGAVLAALTVQKETLAAHTAEIATLKTATVPLGEMVALQTQVNNLQLERAQEKAAAFVDEAIAAGKPLGVMRDRLIALHVQDPEAAKDLVAAVPSLKTAGAAAHAANAGGDDDMSLMTEADKEVARKMGIDPAKMAKAKRARMAEKGGNA